MAEVYDLARSAGAVEGPEVRNANDLFEFVRVRLASRQYLPSLPRLFGRAWRADMLRKLQYAVSCIEETNRVRSLKLLLEEAQKAKQSVRELSDQLNAWKEKVVGSAQAGDLLAYRLA